MPAKRCHWGFDRRAAAALLAGLVGLAAAGGAGPQPPSPTRPSQPPSTQPSPNQPSSTQPAAPPAQPPLEAPTPKPGDSPFMKLTNPHNWTLTITVNIRSWKTRDPDRDYAHSQETWSFESAAVVFPVELESGLSRRSDLDICRGTLSFDDRPVADRYTPIYDRAAGARLGRWDIARAMTGRELQLEVSVPVKSFRTLFDEPGAGRVAWPGPAGWPREAVLCFEPQPYLDFGPTREGAFEPYDPEIMRKLVERWVGKQPQKQPPLVVAKWIAGKVVEHFQPSGTGIATNRLGQIEGIDLLGAEQAAKRGRGTEFDMVCLLAAAYRQAGLPARTVIGYDTGDRDESTFLRGDEKESVRAWVEWALWDEKTGTLTWVPVDIVDIRKRSSRLAQDFMERPLKGFGTMDEGDSLVPFAYQFHPPTTVRAYGSPAFWGWLVMPEPPERALQTLTFRAITTPVRGSQEPRDNRRPDDGEDDDRDRD